MSQTFRRVSRQLRPFLSAGVLVIGIALSVMVFFVMRRLEEQRATARFDRMAQAQFDLFETYLRLTMNDIVSVFAFVNASHIPDHPLRPSARCEFGEFAAPLLARNRALQALEWVPRVPDSLRSRYEEAARNAGIPEFQFTERGPQAQMVRANKYREHFVVYFVDPLRGNEKALGFDNASDPLRSELLRTAAEKGELLASGRVSLVQDASDQYGFIAIKPVYRQGANRKGTDLHGPAELAGFVVGVLRIDNIVQNAGLRSDPEAAFRAVIFDEDGSHGEKLLYPKGAPFNSVAELPQSFRASRHLRVAGRSWQIAAYPVDEEFAPGRRTSWLVLLAGLCLSCVLAAYLRQLQRMLTAAEAARDSEARFRKMVELAPDGIFVVLSGGQVVEVNEAACTQLGYNRARLLELSITDFIAPRFAERVARRLKGVVPPGTYESAHIRADGSEVPIELSVCSISFRGQPAFLGITRDISERKRVQLALQASEDRFRRVVEAAPEGIYVHAGGVIRYINSAALGMFGAKHPSQILGQPFTDRIHPDYHAIVKERVSSLVEERRPAPMLEERFLRLDGSAFDVEVNAIPFEGLDGVIVFFRDISERKRAASQMRELEQQFRQAQKMEAIGRLAGGIAHDFNNLLMAISSYTELLQERLPAHDSLRRNTREILKATVRASSLTAQMLAFGRKQILSPVTLDLNALINETGKMLSRLIGEDVEFVVQPDPSLGLVKADPNQIVQVLMNLCVNARDAMPHGGRLTIETSNRTISEEGAALSPHLPRGRYVVVAVNDSGVGMSQDTQEHIFEPFFTTKGVGKGTGLGLSTVYGIVKQSGGYITVDSELGKGTCFTIYFPSVDEPAACSMATTMKPVSNGTETLLLVEDEEDVREAMCEYMCNLGYKVLAAGSGEQALSMAIEAARLDLLITDIVMPKMSGRELSQTLSGLHPGLRTIFMSGYTDDAILLQGVSEGDGAFLQKPFSMATLANKVRTVIEPAAS